MSVRLKWRWDVVCLGIAHNAFFSFRNLVKYMDGSPTGRTHAAWLASLANSLSSAKASSSKVLSIVNTIDSLFLGTSRSKDTSPSTKTLFFFGKKKYFTMAADIGANSCTIVKAVYSIALLIFSIIVVMALIFDEQTNLSQDVHPGLAFVLIWVALLWLSLVEGGQASMVGLPPIDRELYRESHPISFRICDHGHKGDNLDRYLMGRQFMVLALVFVINLSGAPIEDASVLSLPDPLANAFLKSGLAMILMTCMIGQLNTQVNASHCMLDFINDWGNWFTVKVAMAIEASGLLHASYLIQMIVAGLAGKPIESNEEPRDAFMNILFWGRVLISVGILTFAFVATFAALFDGKTTMWDGVPEVVAVVLFFLLMAVVGMLEGMQIAFFAVAKLTDEERNSSVWASRTCNVLFEGEGHNLPGFMVGRQLCVVSCFFVIARVTSMDVEDGESNVLGVSDGAQEFFNTGLLGALITTIVASIAWQLVASAFPVAFLSTPITYVLLRICLFLEATGICTGAWVLAAIHRKVSGFQRDEVYVGTAEERAAMQHGDKVNGKSDVGHLAGGAFPATHDLPYYESWIAGGNFSERRAKILQNIAILRDQVDAATSMDEKATYEAALKKEVAALRHVNREEGESVRHLEKTNPSAAPKEIEEEDDEDVEDEDVEVA